MPQTGYIYVPAPSRGNLEIGLQSRLWGWRSAALDRAGARDAVKSLQPGDYLLLGYRGPNSRVKPGGWSNAALERVVVTKIAKALFEDTASVWPDDDYPERVELDILSETENVQGSVLGAEPMEALRLSANKQGVAVLLQGDSSLNALADDMADEAEEDSPDPLDHEGAMDGVALRFVRREQKKLRRRKFGSNPPHLTCDLCGRTLPARIVHAAHIKRRSKCSREEQLNLDNVMAACLVGCDALFEHGYVYVDAAGTIQLSPRGTVTSHLEATIAGLTNRSCKAHSPDNDQFFAWHREEIALTGTTGA